MITGPFTPEQKAVLREIAQRKTKRGELKQLAREWDRSISNVRHGMTHARAGGYQPRPRRRRFDHAHALKIGSYTLLMRRIWAEWESAHECRPPTPQT